MSARVKGQAGSATEAVREIDGVLEGVYGDRRRVGTSRDLVDGLVRTILSQNTSDVNSDRAFSSLKDRFPTWEEAAGARVGEIEKAIRSGGISRVKAERIKAILKSLHRERGSYDLEQLREMEPRAAMNYLLEMPGVGRKTAAVLLLFNLGYPFFPVDTHIFRVGKRLGIIPQGYSAEKAHDIMDDVVPDDIKYRFHLNLIEHGRRVCKARKPDCPRCSLNSICPKIGVEREGMDNA